VIKGIGKPLPLVRARRIDLDVLSHSLRRADPEQAIFQRRLRAPDGCEQQHGLGRINVAKAEGAKVIATTRTQTKKEELLGLGADYVIVMQDEDLVARVKEITGGIGARVVLDPIAGKGLPALAQATATGGTIIVAGYLGADMFGYVDGQPTPFPFIDTVGRNLNMRGYNAQSLMRDPAAVAVAKRYVYDLFARGVSRRRSTRSFPCHVSRTRMSTLTATARSAKSSSFPKERRPMTRFFAQS